VAGQGGLATEVRTRLEVIEGGAGRQMKPNKLDELWYRKPVRQHVKEFAALFSIICLTVAAVQIYNGRSYGLPVALIVTAAVLCILGYKAPALLCPVWKGWMKMAQAMGFVMTTLILFVAWSVVLLPMAIGLKIFKRKVMDVSYRMPVSTYWEDRDAKHNDFKLLTRQF